MYCVFTFTNLSMPTITSNFVLDFLNPEFKEEEPTPILEPPPILEPTPILEPPLIQEKRPSSKKKKCWIDKMKRDHEIELAILKASQQVRLAGVSAVHKRYVLKFDKKYDDLRNQRKLDQREFARTTRQDKRDMGKLRAEIDSLKRTNAQHLSKIKHLKSQARWHIMEHQAKINSDRSHQHSAPPPPPPPPPPPRDAKIYNIPPPPPKRRFLPEQERHPSKRRRH